MMEFILFTVIIILLYYVSIFNISTIYYFNLINRYEELQLAAAQTAKEEIFKIQERIGCLGLYDGKEIASHIKLEDGRLFEYVSLAILSPEGYFRSPEPDAVHIRVDENLLYKLIIDK